MATTKKAKQKHQPTKSAMNGVHAKKPHPTKKGPGRYHKAGPVRKVKKEVANAQAK